MPLPPSIKHIRDDNAALPKVVHAIPSSVGNACLLKRGQEQFTSSATTLLLGWKLAPQAALARESWPGVSPLLVQGHTSYGERPMSSKESRAYPKYKPKYRVTNSPEYDKVVIARGDLRAWMSPEAIADWRARRTGGRDAQSQHSDPAIETDLTLRLLLHLPLRQTQGFLGSLSTHEASPRRS